MGNTESRNVLGVTANAFVSQLNETVQNVDGSALNSISFNISNVDGDVNFTGNKVRQKAKVSVRALQNSILCNSAVQGLSQKLMQSAESLTSGIPIGTNTEASNSISAAVNMSMNLRNHVGQTCVARATNEFAFLADKVGGSVNVTGNTFDQEVDAIAECAQTTLSSNSSMQKASQDASQTASAVTKGLDPGDFLRSLALLIGVGALAFFIVMGVAAKAMGRSIKNFFKFLFVLILALILVAASCLAVVLLVKAGGFPEVFTYSNVDFEEMGGSGRAPKDVRQAETLLTCGQACKDDGSCTVFLWEPEAAASDGALGSKKGTCKFYDFKPPEDEVVVRMRLEVKSPCPDPPPALPSAAPSLEAQVEISRGSYLEMDDLGLSRADGDPGAPSKDGPPCAGEKDGEGPMKVDESKLPPASEAKPDETSKASRMGGEEEEDDGISRADAAASSCGRITAAWNAYKECYGKIDSKLKDDERKAKECACLESLVTSTREVATSGACSVDAQRVYYSGNAAMGVVCPANPKYDPSGAPCGMPGQKVVDLTAVRNWVGIKDPGILKFAGLRLGYKTAGFIMVGVALFLIVIVVIASRALRDKNSSPAAVQPTTTTPTPTPTA